MKGDIIMENINYTEVPNIITSKDLDYLNDMFNWNYEALKKTNEAILNIEDEEIKAILEKSYNLFKSNLNLVLSILSEGGTNE